MKRIKKWWFRITHVKCDYCKEPVETYYEAYLFPLKKYKGAFICSKCIHTEEMTEPVVNL
jgi:hypothetical protein